jgi:hypothetical protein
LEALEERYLLSGNTYIVNALGDAGSGSGLSGDIRYCITQADLNPGSTITFTSSLSGHTILLSHGQLAITDNMTITGLGQTSLTISGNDLSRVFDVSAKTATVSISSLTLSGGSISNEGGAIYNAGTLTVSASTLSGNSGGSVGGGAIYNLGGLTVSASTLSGNSGFQGGGILNNGGTVTLSSGSTLSGNSGTFGGGIWSIGTVAVNASILSNNSASSYGGAACHHGFCVAMTLARERDEVGGRCEACHHGFCVAMTLADTAEVLQRLEDAVRELRGLN